MMLNSDRVIDYKGDDGKDWVRNKYNGQIMLETEYEKKVLAAKSKDDMHENFVLGINAKIDGRAMCIWKLHPYGITLQTPDFDRKSVQRKQADCESVEVKLLDHMAGGNYNEMPDLVKKLLHEYVGINYHLFHAEGHIWYGIVSYTPSTATSQDEDEHEDMDEDEEDD